MKLLLWGGLQMLVSLLAQLLVWRIRPPRSSARGLALVFVGGFLVVLSAATMAFPGESPRPAEWIYLAVFQIVCLGVYLINFTMIEAESPSQMITLAVDAAGPAGLPVSRLDAIVHEDLFVKDRLHHLVQGGFLSQGPDGVTMTYRGRLLLYLFLLPRWILGIEKKIG
jgi:hypothetical protein